MYIDRMMIYIFFRKFATLKNYPVLEGDCITDNNTYTNVPSDQYLENQKVKLIREENIMKKNR